VEFRAPLHPIVLTAAPTTHPPLLVSDSPEEGRNKRNGDPQGYGIDPIPQRILCRVDMRGLKTTSDPVALAGRDTDLVFGYHSRPPGTETATRKLTKPETAKRPYVANFPCNNHVTISCSPPLLKRFKGLSRHHLRSLSCCNSICPRPFTAVTRVQILSGRQQQKKCSPAGGGNVRLISP